MTELPSTTLTRGEGLRNEAGREVQDAFAFLDTAQHAEGYRVAALNARLAAGRFENAATLLTAAENADQADRNRCHTL